MNDNDLEDSGPKTASERALVLKEIKSIDPNLGAFNFENLGEVIQFAEVMSKSGDMIPKVFQGNIAACTAITMRARNWGYDPYSLAGETYQVKQGQPVAFQAKVFGAVLRRAGVILQYDYSGDYKVKAEAAKSTKGNQTSSRSAVGDRQLRVWFVDQGVELDYTTPKLCDITIKNSPLWQNDPDQQLGYYAMRGWARRHRPDLMLGASCVDEAEFQRQMRDITPEPTGFARLTNAAKTKPVDAAEEPKANPVEDAEESDPAPEPEILPEIDTKSPAYGMGLEAGREGFMTIEQGPFKDNAPEERDHWMAGYAAAEPQT